MSMVIKTLVELFTRDLNKLKKEIADYRSEENLWRVGGDIKNSGGNLCLHLTGNLKTYIGATFANTGYIRKRDLEFSSKHIAKSKLLSEINATISVVTKGLNNISEKELSGNFPIKIWEDETKMFFTLMHLHSHLNYHIGQINYHRRLFDH